MNVNTCPTPPHPTNEYMHLPAATEKDVSKFTWKLFHFPPHPTPPMNTCTCRQPQSSMPFISKFTWTLIHAPPHPTPPHPTRPHPPNVHKTPRPSKGRGPTKLLLILTYTYWRYMQTIRESEIPVEKIWGNYLLRHWSRLCLDRM